MAEQAQQQQQQQQGGSEEDVHPQLRANRQQHEDNDGPVVRGDGTVLKESDKPRNPKKKMWEEDVERDKFEQRQQEEEQQQQQHVGSEAAQGRKRDEL